MADATLRLAVISADHAFRSVIAQMLHLHSDFAAVTTDIPVAACDVAEEGIGQLQMDGADVVLVDLAGGALTGVELVQRLGDCMPATRLIATGPALSPELLLEAMRAGITEYLPAPVETRDLVDALKRITRRLNRTNSRAQITSGRVITLVGAKGGTGVTTAAANIAVQLQRTQHGKTLLIDLNLEGGSLAVALGLRPRYSIVDLLESLHRFDESLLASLVDQHASGVHVLGSPLLPEAVPFISAEQIRSVLRLLRRVYDTIVIDLARPYTEYGRATIDNSDLVLLMVVPDVLAVHGAKRLLPLIRKGVEGREGRLELVLNRTSGDDQIQKTDVQQALELRIAHELRRDDAGVLASLNLGKPMTMNGSRSRYAKDVRDLATRVAPRTKGAAPPVNNQLSRLFARIGGRKAEAGR
jgi:pilus assembly protein CpaE